MAAVQSDYVKRLKNQWHLRYKHTRSSQQIKLTGIQTANGTVNKTGLCKAHVPHCSRAFPGLAVQNFTSSIKVPAKQSKGPFRSYVYWIVHHLDSWIKRDQLDVTCFIISLLNAQHLSDVNTSVLRSLQLTCWAISWVVLLWFDVCWCYVVVWVWCLAFVNLMFIGPCIIFIVVLQPASRYHTTPAKPQRNTNTHRTRAIQPMK